MEKRIHHGRNVKRLREMLGIKQEALAADLGEDWCQRKVSLMETKEEIEPELRKRIAEIMKVTPEAIENIDDESAINYVNTFSDNSQGAFHYQCTINPIEEWLAAMDKNEKLYERLLQAEREKVELLQKMLDKK